MGLFVDSLMNGQLKYSDGSEYINTSYNLGEGNNYCKTRGSGVTISAGSGNNGIATTGNDNKITTGSGNNSVKVNGNNTSVTTGNGNDSIDYTGNNGTINSGNGKNVINYTGNCATILTGDNDDEVVFVGDTATIQTKGGKDSVTAIGNNVKITTGDGDDTVIFWGDNNNISTGAGDDTVITYDNLFKQSGITGTSIENAFLKGLRTGVWEDWTLICSELTSITSKRSLFKKKTFYTYQDYYLVQEVYSQYMSGCKNTSIDLGEGNNTAIVNLDKATSKITGNGDITKTDAWQTNQVISTRAEEKTRVEVTSKTSWKGFGFKLLTAGIYGTGKKTYQQNGNAELAIDTSDLTAYTNNLISKNCSDSKYTKMNSYQYEAIRSAAATQITNMIKKANS